MRARASRTLRLTAVFALALALTGCLSFQAPGERYEYPGAPFQYTELLGQRIHYRVVGPKEGPSKGDVVLIHGFAGALVSWWFVQDALAQHYRVVALDLKGFGLSDKLPGDYSIEAEADLVLALMDQLGIGSAHLVGHSWGCSLALRLASTQPKRVRSLVLAAGYVYADQVNGYLRWSRLPGVGELLFGLFYDEQLEARYTWSYFEPERHVRAVQFDYLRQFQAAPGVTAAALAATRGMDLAALEPSYRSIARPALLLWGAEDRVSPPAVGERLAAELPHARLVVLPRSGHSVMIERAGAFNDLVLEFLGS